MSKRLLFVLGPPDSELETIAELLRSRGVSYLYACDKDGNRVKPENAFECLPQPSATHYVKCRPCYKLFEQSASVLAKLLFQLHVKKIDEPEGEEAVRALLDAAAPVLLDREFEVVGENQSAGERADWACLAAVLALTSSASECKDEDRFTNGS